MKKLTNSIKELSNLQTQYLENVDNAKYFFLLFSDVKFFLYHQLPLLTKEQQEPAIVDKKNHIMNEMLQKTDSSFNFIGSLMKKELSYINECDEKDNSTTKDENCFLFIEKIYNQAKEKRIEQSK